MVCLFLKHRDAAKELKTIIPSTQFEDILLKSLWIFLTSLNLPLFLGSFIFLLRTPKCSFEVSRVEDSEKAKSVDISSLDKKKQIFEKVSSFEPILESFNTKESFNFPCLTLSVIDAKILSKGQQIYITPTSIDSKTTRIGEHLWFGKEDHDNAFNFPEQEHVGRKQFELFFDISNLSVKLANNQYSIKDCRKGTGLFVRITQQILGDDYIFSFYNTHMCVYRVLSDNVLSFKLMNGPQKDRY